MSNQPKKQRMISFEAPPDLGDKIKAAAKAESRTVSAWIRIQLADAIEKLVEIEKEICPWD